ncbi:hypothetical protein V8G54_007170 [Vigna mungo]|uniref:Uncharacterized protein n=1 Tax=Vigna mungo TaxID=3915 RepID=A0AAQ3S818_VIGMU
MGNIPSSNNYSESFPLDNYSEVLFRKTKNRKLSEVINKWSAEYCLFRRTSCELELTKITRYNHEEEVFISIHDHTSSYAKDDFDFRINITVENGLLLANVSLDGPRSTQQLPERKVPMEQGGVLKSSFFLYGGDADRKGLVIILREKRCDDDEELPYMITVKHCFVASCSSHDVSVVAKIRSNGGDGGLSVEIEKPRKHPKGELLKMFDDVKGKEMEFGNQNNGNVPDMNISGQQNISALSSSSGYTHGDYNNAIIFRRCIFRLKNRK